MRKTRAWITMVRKGLVGFALAILLASAAGWAGAADLAGAKDHPLVKRFGGSEIVGYDSKRFVEYDLQTSTFTSYDLGPRNGSMCRRRWRCQAR